MGELSKLGAPVRYLAAAKFSPAYAATPRAGATRAPVNKGYVDVCGMYQRRVLPKLYLDVLSQT